MLRNALTYLTGSVLGQVLMLAVIPVLSRLYTPADFGLFGIFSAFLSVIGVAACLRFELAIPLPSTKRQAAQVFAAGATALACACMIMLLLVMMGRDAIAAALDAPRLAVMLWLLPLSVLGYGVYELLNYWATRSGRFKILAVSQITRAAGASGTQIAVGAALGGPLGLVFGQLAGQWAANLALGWRMLQQDRGVIASGFKWERIIEQARRYRTFAVHGAPQAALNSASQAVPAIMLGWLFSPGVVGFYFMAQRVVSAPMTLISQSLRQAMLPYFARQHQAGHSLRPLLHKYTWFLALLGFPALLILLIYGEDLFVLVLGASWRNAGRYAAWLAPWLWTNMLNPPTSIVLITLERQKTQFLAEIALLLGRFVAISIGGALASPRIAIALYSLTGVAFNVVMLIVAHSACRQEENRCHR